ncbi:MAG: hypothetical protein ACHQF2_05540 [Flavobacteriales bacterium]
MNKKNIVLLLLFFSNLCYSQSFRSGFDFYEFNSGGQGQGLSFNCNAANDLNNAVPGYLFSYIEMYKSTHDIKYLDKFVLHAKRLQERRDDHIQNVFVANFTTCQNIPPIPNIPSSKGWSIDEDVNPPCDGWIPVVHHSGNLCTPMAKFVFLMKTDPDFIAIGNEPLPPEATLSSFTTLNPGPEAVVTYNDFAFFLQKKVNETLDYHECNWDCCGSGLYRHDNSCSTGSCGAGCNSNSSDLHAVNIQCSIGRALAYMYLVESLPGGNSSLAGTYWNRVTNIANRVRSELVIQSQDPGAYSWCHDYDDDDPDDCLCVEDISHANLLMEFAHICHQNNIASTYNTALQLFYSTDMQMLSNTFSRHLYRQPNIFGQGVFENGIVCETGSDVGAYVFLTQYNPYVYQIISDYYDEEAIYGGSGDLIGFAQLTQYQHIFNSVAVLPGSYDPVIIPIVNETLYVANPTEYSATACGDFDNDGFNNIVVLNSLNSTLLNYSIDNNRVLQLSSSQGFIQNLLTSSNLDGLPGEELIKCDGFTVGVMKLNSGIFSSIANASIFGIVQIAVGDIDGNSVDEIVAVTATGQLYALNYNGTGNLISTLVGNLGNSPRAIGLGNLDGNTANGDELAITLNNKKVEVWSLNGGLTMLYDYIDATNTNVIWGTNKLAVEDFDEDGVDEIIAYNDYASPNGIEGSSFYILKIVNGVLKKSGQEFFPHDQLIGSISSMYLPQQERHVLVVPRNYDGQITLFTMEGLCPGIHIENVTIDGNTSIDNIHTNTVNNYTIDYHSPNNILTSGMVHINSPAITEFVSGTGIYLKPGFEAHAGSESRGSDVVVNDLHENDSVEAYLLQPPSGLSPEFNTTSTGSAPTFSWNGTGDSRGYQVEVVSTEKLFPQAWEGFSKESTINYPSLNPLKLGAQYRYKVISMDFSFSRLSILNKAEEITARAINNTGDLPFKVLLANHDTNSLPKGYRVSYDTVLFRAR